MTTSVLLEGSDGAAVETVLARLEGLLVGEEMPVARGTPQIEAEPAKGVEDILDLVRTGMQAVALFFSIDSWLEKRRTQGRAPATDRSDAARVAEKLIAFAKEAYSTNQVTISLDARGKNLRLDITTVPKVVDALLAAGGADGG